MGWTTTELLTRIRTQARLSSGMPDYTDAILLDKADFAIYDRFIPAIISVKEDYYAAYLDRALVANRQAYAFPSRAFGSTLREVVYVDGNGDTYRLPIMAYGTRLNHTGDTASRPTACVVEDDRVLLLPTPSEAVGSVRLCYEYRPGILVATSAAMVVTAVADNNPGEDSWTLSGTVPAGITDATPCDLIKGTPPFSLISADKTPIDDSEPGGGLAFTTADIDTSRIAIGDYVCLSGQSCIPQIPAELHSALATAVAAEIMAELGDDTLAGINDAKVSRTLEIFKRVAAPRVKAPPRKIVNVRSNIRSRIAGVGRVGSDDGEP